MICKIADDGEPNSFCAGLSEDDRAVLCEQCTRRSLLCGHIMFKEDTKSSIFVVQKGFMVALSPFDEDRYFQGIHPGMGMQAEGFVFSCDLVCSPSRANEYEYYNIHSDTQTTAYTDTVLGRWPLSLVRELYAASPSFARELFRCNIEMHGSTCELAAALRAKDAKSAVKFILCFAESRDAHLTHQQIAEITGFNRTSVSRIMAALPREDPSFTDKLASLG